MPRQEYVSPAAPHPKTDGRRKNPPIVEKQLNIRLPTDFVSRFVADAQRAGRTNAAHFIASYGRGQTAGDAARIATIEEHLGVIGAALLAADRRPPAQLAAAHDSLRALISIMRAGSR